MCSQIVAATAPLRPVVLSVSPRLVARYANIPLASARSAAQAVVVLLCAFKVEAVVEAQLDLPAALVH